jgi:hypothetical protein
MYFADCSYLNDEELHLLANRHAQFDQKAQGGAQASSQAFQAATESYLF